MLKVERMMPMMHQADDQGAPDENCTHDCSSCGADCPSRSGGIQKAQLNEHSSIKKVIGVVSGKGIMPAVTPTEISLMSINLLVENETDPVVWRGPVIGGVVEQFWTDVCWGDLDVLFIDMPPGTGDVPLTVFQSLPIDGIIVVTSPQDLVSMIVAKAVNMANLMNIPVLGLVENMSYITCPDCGRKIEMFGPSQAEAVAAANGIKLLERLPIDPVLSQEADAGKIEFNEGTQMESILGVLDAIGLKEA